MSNKLTIREGPNKKNIESLDLTRKVNLLRLVCGNKYSIYFLTTKGQQN